MTSECTVRPIPTSNNRWSDKLGICGVAAEDPVKISVVPSGQPPIGVVSCAHMNIMTLRRPACPAMRAAGASIDGRCNFHDGTIFAQAPLSSGYSQRFKLLSFSEVKHADNPSLNIDLVSLHTH